MAQKNSTSRAEKVVSDARKKSPGASTASSGKSSDKKKKNSSRSKTPSVKTEYEHSMPSGAMLSFVSLVLFVLFVVISVNPEGALLQVIQAVLLGLIGQGGFYFAIPALLYLFVINTFGRKYAVRMRSICTVVFVFMCGCIFHLVVQTQGMASGAAVVADLYIGGAEGTTGGILCGGGAMLMRWACGNIFAFILCIFIAVFTLLGAMGITPPSLYRAIANRPRDDYEEEEKPYIEPATVVVNHIANKQIEHKRQRRQAQQTARELQVAQTAQLPQNQELPQSAQSKRTAPKAKEIPAEIPAPVREEPVPDSGSGTPSRAKNIMDTIGMEADSATPAQKIVAEPRQEATSPKPVRRGILVEAGESEPIPRQMPKLERDIEPPSFVMAKTETTAKPEPLRPNRDIDAFREDVKPGKAEAKSGKVTSKEAAESAKQVASEIEKNQNTPRPCTASRPLIC